MSQYMTYVIGQGDTLETISQSQLESDQVNDIVALNNLRYPYISDNPYDHYAQSKGTLQLLGPITLGVNRVTFGNQNGIKVNPLDTIFFQDITLGAYEAATVNSVSTASNGNITITFQTILQHWYTMSAVVTAFVNQQNVATKVLKTGDTLYLPVTVPNVYSINQSTTDVFGTDIALDENGAIAKANNDWATVSGKDNVSQAVRNRWNTPMGGLPREPNYGNRQHELVGELNQSYYWSLALSFAKQAALSDPRVQSVDNMTLTVMEDKTSQSAAITAVNSQSFVVQADVNLGGES